MVLTAKECRATFIVAFTKGNLFNGAVFTSNVEIFFSIDHFLGVLITI